ncbi:unnamed protein product [Ciceribacter selenitireducens ATCC BAA-1503]|uniref:Uncharacterized protein n=1 Tax=Ciceribacter selenitireducens ATCC BAA-1503 TaxID=1336235 RepID=A0A376AGX3_9HYPH|nr:unnamed protein product [Ciceribacter selenitireducens ATCC BAA-1503]
MLSSDGVIMVIAFPQIGPEARVKPARTAGADAGAAAALW